MREQNARLHILEMIDRGEINAQEALRMLEAMNDAQNPPPSTVDELTPEKSLNQQEKGDAFAKSETGTAEAHSLPEEMQKWQRFWQLPLWIGITLILLSGFGLYRFILEERYTFWMECTSVIFILGVLMLFLGARTRNATWLHLRIRQKEGEFPRKISLSFPIPLRPIQWFLRRFRQRLPQLENTTLDEVLLAVQRNTTKDSPIYIQVDEGTHGEQVEIYIG